MEHFSKWVAGVVVGLLGLLGLFMASRAADDIFYATGLGLFVIAVAVIFYLIHRAFDEAKAHRH